MAWLGWASECEALLHGTVPIFGINVLCTCPLTLSTHLLDLAWAGLGQLSPADKFDKLKSVVGWIITQEKIQYYN